jgi:hypothetical protein
VSVSSCPDEYGPPIARRNVGCGSLSVVRVLQSSLVALALGSIASGASAFAASPLAGDWEATGKVRAPCNRHWCQARLPQSHETGHAETELLVARIGAKQPRCAANAAVAGLPLSDKTGHARPVAASRRMRAARRKRGRAAVRRMRDLPM